MSRSLIARRHAPGCWALICAFTLAPMGACHQQSSIPGRPSSPDTVPVGYGQQLRAKTGGAVQSATAEDLKNARAQRVEELLVGRFAGVRVMPTATGGFSIRIRSGASFSNSEPLYVIDGLPVEVVAGRGLDFLNPADIARIDILRDPAETSMFGGRGANGVVLITTKLNSKP